MFRTKNSPETESKNLGPLVGAIDQGTSSTRFMVFSATNAELVTYHQVPVTRSYPAQGWVEQDPLEILAGVVECIDQTVKNLEALQVDPVDVVAVGLTNQRETTIVWDKFTGLPIHPAIVWNDTRTMETVSNLLAGLPRDPNSINHLQHLCGLPISTYFSALKLKWLMDNVPDVRSSIAANRALFGTMDSWLLWNLTGGSEGGGRHVTDVTNASRTMLMNLETLKWDAFLCSFFRVPMSILPEIRSSAEIYGDLSLSALRGVPLASCLGDQQAALLGQNCLRPGQGKNTYGTGCFMLYNVGPTVVYSRHGLLATCAYKLGPHKPVVYALEGAVATAGAIVTWLKDMNVISNSEEMERLASEVSDSGDVHFVPAFSGLFAPHWRPDARGLICGLTQYSTRSHVCRAAFDAICLRTWEIIEAMQKDSGFELSTLLVDGGMAAANDTLMQMQADLLGLPVLRPSMSETSALGAAAAAGQAAGVDVWDMRTLAGGGDTLTFDRFLPRLTHDEREVRYERWKAAVQRSLGWAQPEAAEALRRRRPIRSQAADRLLASIPGAVFIFTSFILFKIAHTLH